MASKSVAETIHEHVRANMHRIVGRRGKSWCLPYFMLSDEAKQLREIIAESSGGVMDGLRDDNQLLRSESAAKSKTIHELREKLHAAESRSQPASAPSLSAKFVPPSPEYNPTGAVRDALAAGKVAPSQSEFVSSAGVAPAATAATAAGAGIRTHEGRKYLRRIYSAVDPSQSVEIDVYSVLEAYAVHCPATAHALKKLLCAGQRGKGGLSDDLIGAIAAINRAIELAKVREMPAGTAAATGPAGK